MTDKTKAMDKLIAQDADLLEITRPISNERDLGQPWLRTYDAHLKVEWQAGYDAGIEAAANALEADARLCDCAARKDCECACGAWDDYKTITSARAVEIVRKLKEQSK